MHENKITRRQFIKTGVAAGLALSIPVSAEQLFAADSPKQRWNERMIARLAEADLPDPFEFIFCADTHIPWDNRGVFRKIAKKANEMGVAFVIIGGDTVQVGNPHSFRSLRKALKRFNMPVLCAIGNHDTAYENYSDWHEWEKRFGNPYFRFDAGSVRFICLNNANHHLSEENYEFLEKSLKTDRRKIVVMHRPANYLNPIYSTPMEDEEGRFRKLVEEGGVTAVLTGHEHHSGIYKVGGVQYIVSGGAGGQLNTDTKNNFHHFVHTRVGKYVFDFKVMKI